MPQQLFLLTVCTIFSPSGFTALGPKRQRIEVYCSQPVSKYQTAALAIFANLTHGKKNLPGRERWLYQFLILWGDIRCRTQIIKLPGSLFSCSSKTCVFKFPCCVISKAVLLQVNWDSWFRNKIIFWGPVTYADFCFSVM